MAGAFLTPTLSASNNPSVFQVVAQNSLMETLKPAFSQIIKVLANCSPRHFNLAFKFRDELYLLLNSALQIHYLKLFSSSFAENFYGLERSPVLSGTLSLKPSYLLLVLVPYLQGKAQRIFEKLREDEADGVVFETKTWNTLRSIFVKLYPFYHCTWELANLGLLFSYCLNKSKYHSLFAVLAGYNLVYQTQDTRQSSSDLQQKLSSTRGVQQFMYKLVSSAANGLTFGLEMGSFFLQVVDHWYNNTSAELKLEHKIVGPPPLIAGLKPGLCPLCGKKRRGDTVLGSSGVVFCYSCITQYIRKKKKCPVTKEPSQEEQLVRVFYNQD